MPGSRWSAAIEFGQRIEHAPSGRARESSCRPSCPASGSASASSTLRCASLIAATIRSCSISTSSFDTTSGSILIDSNVLVAVDDDGHHAAAGGGFDASSRPSASAGAPASAAPAASFSECSSDRCLRAPAVRVSHNRSRHAVRDSTVTDFFYVLDLAAEDVEHGLHGRLGFRAGAEIGLRRHLRVAGGGLGAGAASPSRAHDLDLPAGRQSARSCSIQRALALRAASAALLCAGAKVNTIGSPSTSTFCAWAITMP